MPRPSLPARTDADAIDAAAAAPGDAGAAPDVDADVVTVPLWRAAHGRTGDKGDRSNISVVAWHPELYAPIVEQITPAVVAAAFAHRRPTHVARHELPRLHALNFVLDGVLDGGVNDSLNLDGHGKALSFRLLDLPLRVPRALLPRLRGAD